MIVQLGLSKEAQVVLGWFPGDRSARLLRATGACGVSLDISQLVKHIDLSLKKSGESFCFEELVEIARWGHFTDVALPWERFGQL
jgi:hypothetical protein